MSSSLRPGSGTLAERSEDSLETEAKTGEDYSRSAMIALRPSEECLKALAGMDECTEDISDLHITLKYLGKIPDDAGDEWARERLFRGLYGFGVNAGYRGLTGRLNGFGAFYNGEENVLLALWDIPFIAEFRTNMLRYPEEHGYRFRIDDHGFIPHTTLAYADTPVRTLPDLPADLPEKVHFTSIWLAWGEEWNEIGLS